MKNVFVKEVGCENWEEAQSKFPLHATTDQLQQFSGQAFINGLPSPTLQHHCQKALRSVIPGPSGATDSEAQITLVNKVVDNQDLQVALIDLTINDIDSTAAAKVTPIFSGFPLTVTTILTKDEHAEEKVCTLYITK